MAHSMEGQMNPWINEELVLETCDPPEIIEMTPDEKNHEMMIHQMMFGYRGSPTLSIKSEWTDGNLIKCGVIHE